VARHDCSFSGQSHQERSLRVIEDVVNVRDLASCVSRVSDQRAQPLVGFSADTLGCQGGGMDRRLADGQTWIRAEVHEEVVREPLHGRLLVLGDVTQQQNRERQVGLLLLRMHPRAEATASERREPYRRSTRRRSTSSTTAGRLLQRYDEMARASRIP
jgi:hypothetical protein